MSDVVTVKKAEAVTGKDRAYWSTGKGKKFTVKGDDGNLWVCLHKFNEYMETLWLNTQVSDKPAKAPSRSASPIKANDSTRSLKSSPTLEGCA
ncbi:hypothetical protein THIOSC15_1260002 [uncultured Thiomicrorhabdus sp.]